MGWLWSSTLPDSRPSSVQEKSSSFPPQSIPEAAASSTSPSTSTPSKPPTRDELAEQELQSFLSEIAADTAPKASSTKYNRIAKLPPSSTQPKSTPSEDPNEPLSTALLPTTMSCRDAFDAAFYCNSFGGRFNDLYRHGTLRSCSSTWNDFWFCMRTRGYSGPEKEAAIKEHYLRKQDAKYSKGLGKESSENVWRSRDRKMEWGAAFNEPYEEDDVKVSDEEWRRGEREWRSKEAAVGTVSQSQRGS
jgi:hypothetical protein